MKLPCVAFLLFASFIFVESFIVPLDWLSKHGYSLNKNQTSSSKKYRNFKGKTRVLENGIPVGPFSDDFMAWLEDNSYADYNFPNLHLGVNASFGGKESEYEEVVKHRPVIFIHGNSDGALDDGTEYSSGFSHSIKYFLSKGRTPADLYAVTWGDRKLEKSFIRMHTCSTLIRLRRFVEAVMKYTNAYQVDIIAHSMGVTLARQIILGGKARDELEECDLGESMIHKIKSFIGIAGANYGLCMCNQENQNDPKMKVCGRFAGFFSGPPCYRFPRASCSDLSVPDECIRNVYAKNLLDLNINNNDMLPFPLKPAENVVSFWSNGDEIIGNNTVWGRPTSLIPGSEEFMIFEGLRHHQLKTDTVREQYEFIVGIDAL